ncbi:hypothetical protein GNI_067690 [Gregarina niphandrodes]|uniref:Transmembrane protein n=1 Tax=Gregarina niphandrodes TaxID=110365 RepID=A0A023B7M8_GRENI|nr:hypothetical protein GNI_067690 [Gregarina niphandrodes]EZG67583.1 hypothetical protein GNI_067690 [Gregarina niphandrodes]|eukprot:XP_011130199.1 hypothetical protein GNI_067690 [Gregarina niphandrodes]
MKFAIASVVATLAGAVPLPAGPPNLQKWIKINEVEYPVPSGMHPENYRQQLSDAGIAPRSQEHSMPMSPQFPRPIRTIQSVAVQPASVQSVNVVPTIQHYSMPAVQQGYEPSLLQPFQIQHSSGLWNGALNPVGMGSQLLGAHYMAGPTLGGHVTHSQIMNNQIMNNQIMNNQIMGGQRQWVKLREGTDPIEVPFGSDPQSYLDSIRAGRRNLSQVSLPVRKFPVRELQVGDLPSRELRKSKTQNPNLDPVISRTTQSTSKEEYYSPRGSDTFAIPADPHLNLMGAYVNMHGDAPLVPASMSHVPGLTGGLWHAGKNAAVHRPSQFPVIRAPVIYGSSWTAGPQVGSGLGAAGSKNLQLHIGHLRSGKESLLV